MNEPAHGRRRPPPTEDSFGELGLAVHLDERDDYLLVTVRGVIDFWSAGPLQEELNAALKRNPPRLVLDVRDVTFVDSTGLGLLLSIQHRAGTVGGWLRLVRPQPQLRRLLRTTNLDRHFAEYPSVEAAAATPSP